MGGGTGPADPATTRPMFSVWWISEVLNSISTLCADNQLLDRGISQNTGMEQAIEFLCKQTGQLFSSPFPLCQTTEKFPL